MEIQNASTASSKSNQLRNVNTVRWESRIITTQPGEIDDRKSEVIVFVVNAGMNITVNDLIIDKIRLDMLYYQTRTRKGIIYNKHDSVHKGQ